MSENGNFWTDRFKKNGHTGWFDPNIYAFDQFCRLHVFERWLKEEFPHPGKALDFGCGTGDFSRFLVQRGWQVIAYDKYIAPLFRHPSASSTNDLRKALVCGPFDLVISITVLDFIMDDSDFAEHLRLLSANLKPDGKFFFLECSPENDMPASHYQRFRPMVYWLDALEDDLGLSVDNPIPFFHPEYAPIKAWKMYRRSIPIRSVSKLQHYVGKQPIFDAVRKRYVEKALRKFPYVDPDWSIINVISGCRSPK